MASGETAGIDELKLAPGRLLGKYRLVRRLGAGSYGEVWKARDTVEGIWVALKLPLVDDKDRAENEAILREVSTLARLRHRHIMPLKNADLVDGRALLATELSVGTLADRSKPMSARRIFAIIAQVLAGLAYAHKQHLVHCDVTPGNIFLFPDGRAALGDFGISLRIKGRMSTIDEYGTPGYVAPEQAYGRPTYRSDCFSVSLILYQYLTGYLPRWPFRWPLRGYARLRERSNWAVVKLLRQGLSVDPARRFANAESMLSALIDAWPEAARDGLGQTLPRSKRLNWRRIRREAFMTRYEKSLATRFSCVDCGEPIAESMLVCPWCGSERNRFDSRTEFSHICPRCHRGVLPEWRFCPWCYGPGFAHPADRPTPGVRYHDRCRYCGGKLIRFMRYCPWCRRKVRRPWQLRSLPHLCGRCGSSVDADFWEYCPWCSQRLSG